MTADEREAAGCLRRTKENENGKSQATENGVRTPDEEISNPIVKVTRLTFAFLFATDV